MRSILNIPILLLILASVMPQQSKAFGAGDFSNFNLVFINGVHTDQPKAIDGARATAGFLMQPEYKVVALLNSNEGPLLDLLEAYRLAQIDGANNNTSNFWRWVGNPVLAPIPFQKIYYLVLSSHTNPLSSAFSDLSKMKSKIDSWQSVKKKTIIFSHSEGNFFSNQLVDLVTQSDPDLGQNCTGIVAVATPATRVANNDPWVTNTKDVVIGAARLVFPGSILPANSNGLISSLDESGHGYSDTYLTQFNLRADIATSVDTVLARINQDCVDSATCGQPLNPPRGGQGRNQSFTYSVANQVAQQLDVTFEAFYIPDRLTVSGNGITLIDTNEPISGYHQYPVNYDPAIHGDTLDVVVDAPFDGTAWEFCVNCAAADSSCSLVNSRSTVSWRIEENDYVCGIQAVYFDGQREPSTRSGFVSLTSGLHQFSKEGFCVCDGLTSDRCPRTPTLLIGYDTYPLPGSLQGNAIVIDVN